MSDGRFAPKHGEILNGTRSREYIAWQAMRSRCLYKRNNRYSEYGGRGITVCERWNSFENFLADMGRKPGPRHTIDRYPDKDGNYEPGNCRWATYTEQNRNRKNTLTVEIDGESITLVEACSKIGANYFKVRKRMKRGISFAEASTVVRVRCRA